MPEKMASRSEILDAVRRLHKPAADLPALDADWITYPDRIRQFAETLHGVGGLCLEVGDEQQLRDELNRLDQVKSAKKTCSLISNLLTGGVDLAAVADPHDLEDIDVAVVPGQFGVAENAAIWVTDESLRHRAILFIPQHLVLVVKRDEVLDNMHQAYERLRFEGRGFGVFISGPSKTADIEQSLVIGAHGPRSLTVFLLGKHLG